MVVKFATMAFGRYTADPFSSCFKLGSGTEILDHIAKIGFDGINSLFSPVPGQSVLNMDAKTAMAELSKRNLGVATCSLTRSRNFYDRSEHDKIFAETEKNVEAAQSLGITASMILAPSRYLGGINRMDDGKFNALVDCWNKMGEIAAGHGVKMGVHPDTGTGCWLWDEIIKVLEATDPKYVGLTVETGHMITAGKTTDDIVELMDTYAKRVVFFHLKDAIRPGVQVNDPPPSWNVWKKRFREIGHGEIDWERVALAIKRIGFDGWIAVELDLPETPIESDMISIACINRYIRPLLK
jgi:sugar phosphate isomerase/epimerase